MGTTITFPTNQGINQPSESTSMPKRPGVSFMSEQFQIARNKQSCEAFKLPNLGKDRVTSRTEKRWPRRREILRAHERRSTVALSSLSTSDEGAILRNDREVGHCRKRMLPSARGGAGVLCGVPHSCCLELHLGGQTEARCGCGKATAGRGGHRVNRS